MFEVKERLEGG